MKKKGDRHMDEMRRSARNDFLKKGNKANDERNV